MTLYSGKFRANHSGLLSNLLSDMGKGEKGDKSKNSSVVDPATKANEVKKPKAVPSEKSAADTIKIEKEAKEASVLETSETQTMKASELRRQEAALKARKYVADKLKRLNRQIENEEALEALTFEEVETRIKVYDQHWMSFLEKEMEVVTTVTIEEDEEMRERSSETEILEDAYGLLYPKLLKRVKQLAPVDAKEEAKRDKIQVEVRSTEVSNT